MNCYPLWVISLSSRVYTNLRFYLFMGFVYLRIFPTPKNGSVGKVHPRGGEISGTDLSKTCLQTIPFFIIKYRVVPNRIGVCNHTRYSVNTIYICRMLNSLHPRCFKSTSRKVNAFHMPVVPWGSYTFTYCIILKLYYTCLILCTLWGKVLRENQVRIYIF